MIALILALVAAFTLHAELDPNSSLERIRRFDVLGARVPIGSACEELLLAAQARLGRTLTDTEIHTDLVTILQTTEETLIRFEPPESRPNFGVGIRTMIETWDGKVVFPIFLKQGSEVASYNLATGKRVRNTVQTIEKIYRSKALLFPNAVEGKGAGLCIGRNQSFYAWSDERMLSFFVTLKEARSIRNDFPVVGILGKDFARQYFRIPPEEVKREDLFLITLAEAPHNFTANGRLIPDAYICRSLAQYE